MGYSGQGLDPGSQFTLNLINSLGQQIKSGREQAREEQFLNELKPQLDQALEQGGTDQLFNTLLQASLTPGISQRNQEQVQKAAQIAQQRENAQANARNKEMELQRKIDLSNQQIKEAQEKKDEKLKEKTIPLRTSLSTIKTMQEIRNRSNLGRLTGVVSTVNPWGNTAADKTAWLTNARKLIGIANTPGLVIRNQKEFEAISGDLLNPNLSDAQANALLDQLERTVSEELSLLSNNNNFNQNRVRIRFPDGRIANLPKENLNSILTDFPGAKVIE